jgi:hypothetical protein
MDKAYPSKTPMIVCTLERDKDPFRSRDGEEILGHEYPYLSAIGALMYLANNTKPDIAFAVNLLARYSASPTKRHWTKIKNILRYLHGTTDLGLFYGRNQDPSLVGYTDWLSFIPPQWKVSNWVCISEWWNCYFLEVIQANSSNNIH